MAPHAHHDKRIDSVTCAVLTISDTRTPNTDEGGAIIRESLTAHGHRIKHYEIIPDEPARVAERVKVLCQSAPGAQGCQVVLLTGGTGLTTRDTTFEAVSGLLDKELPGFGELFRMLSYEQIGPAAMLSRAVAGTIHRSAVFVMPGSPAAVQLALDKLILPELGHVAWLLGR